jgi:hypothetical protein
LGKLTDDLAEEGIKALLIASAPAAAATAARYIGLGAGVAWYLAHRGREAVLPRYACIEITFNRAVNVERPAQSLR